MKSDGKPRASKRGKANASDFDPLDAEGKGPNILTGAQEYSDERREWAKVWEKFPVYAMKDKLRSLVESIDTNRVTVVVSGTGSGKTVLAVPLVMSHVVKRADVHGEAAKVAVTIPKRAAVAAAAERGAITMDVKLGKQVGFLHRGAPSWSYDDRKTRLVYATDGTLLAQIRKDPLLRAYGAVVVDEAHERPVPTDLLLAALKRTLIERPEFRLVVMSATIDPKLFVDYFGGGGGEGLSTGIVEVSGAPMHPIERVHSVLPGSVDGAPPKEYLNPTLEQACKVLETESKEPPNVIVFVPTTKDSSQGCRALDKMCKKASKECFSLYGKMSNDDKASALALREDSDVRARVYVSTNVAESSLTLDGITHVIDTGLQLSSTWDPRAHGSKIVKGMATRAQITQRIGRAGRTGPGKAILLYSKEKFEAQPAYPPPAILGVDLAEHTLAELAGTHSQAIESVHAHFAALITPPTRSQVVGSISALHFYGLVEITAFGSESGQRSASAIPYNLIPYETLAPPDEPPKSKKRSSKKEKEVAPKWTSPFEGKATPLGRLVQSVSGMAKMGVWGALMVVAGAAYDCVEDAYQLAVILESCDGELSSLWKEQATPDRSPDTVKLLKDTEFARLHPQSDHAALLGFYRQNVAPRTQENRRIAEKLLAFGPWQKVFEAIRRDGGRTIAFVTERKQEVAEWFRRLPHLPLNDKSNVSPLIRAVAVSRAYLACVHSKAKTSKKAAATGAPTGATTGGTTGGTDADAAPAPAPAPAPAAPAGGSKMKTLFPIAKVEVSVDQPITVVPTAIPRDAVAFTEGLVNAGGQWKAGGITWVPREALSSWMSLAASASDGKRSVKASSSESESKSKSKKATKSST